MSHQGGGKARQFPGPGGLLLMAIRVNVSNRMSGCLLLSEVMEFRWRQNAEHAWCHGYSAGLGNSHAGGCPVVRSFPCTWSGRQRRSGAYISCWRCFLMLFTGWILSRPIDRREGWPIASIYEFHHPQLWNSLHLISSYFWICLCLNYIMKLLHELDWQKSSYFSSKVGYASNFL